MKTSLFAMLVIFSAQCFGLNILCPKGSLNLQITKFNGPIHRLQLENDGQIVGRKSKVYCAQKTVFLATGQKQEGGLCTTRVLDGETPEPRPDRSLVFEYVLNSPYAVNADLTTASGKMTLIFENLTQNKRLETLAISKLRCFITK